MIGDSLNICHSLQRDMLDNGNPTSHILIQCHLIVDLPRGFHLHTNHWMMWILMQQKLLLLFDLVTCCRMNAEK
jgi:hypothetical protein